MIFSEYFYIGYVSRPNGNVFFSTALDLSFNGNEQTLNARVSLHRQNVPTFKYQSPGWVEISFGCGFHKKTKTR